MAWLAWLALAAATAGANSTPAYLRLDGEWNVVLDRHDVGLTDRWFQGPLARLEGAQTISLPGSLPTAGIGDPVSLDTPWIGKVQLPEWYKSPQYARYAGRDDFRFPFWLQPEHYYSGVAWYDREIHMPAAGQGRAIRLLLERPHWATELWVDGRRIGAANSLSTPHEYDLGLLPTGPHRLTLRVDNRLVVDVGINSHSVSDHTQGNWNGVVGRMEVRICDGPPIDSLRVATISAREVEAAVAFATGMGQAAKGKLLATVREKRGGRTVGTAEQPVTIDGPRQDRNAGGGEAATIRIALEQPLKPWSEFNPRLYELEVRFQADGSSLGDTARTTFGFRQIGTEGTQFVLNGNKIFFRGTLECAIFPKTGHPPTDVDSWKRIVRIAKAHGLNMIRFHSWCPPEAAFVAADELGFYYQVECASWANGSTTIGDGKPVDQWVYDEAHRILRCYGNHPSFVLMLYGNEPGGPNHKAYLSRWVEHFKAFDPRRLYSSGSGWPELPENQFHVTPKPRIHASGGGMKARINAAPPETLSDYTSFIAAEEVPVISHEIGQWCVYPNFEEMAKYTGYLKPRNFSIFKELLDSHGMGRLAKPFLLASGKLQTLCYKEDIESALRTPGMAGFQLLDLHDFPGQGTALVGVLDPFWDSKGYVTADEFRRFSGSTVPLARLAKRVFTGDETLRAQLDVAHFGAEPLAAARAVWKLADEGGRAVASGQLPAQAIPLGNGTRLGEIEIDLARLQAPARYKLVVGIADTPIENDWDVWVYPARVETAPPAGVVLSRSLDRKTLDVLRQGGKVLLAVPPVEVKQTSDRPTKLGFSSIFWNTAWFPSQSLYGLGIYCDPLHPALEAFPTEYHSNWQWWYLISQAEAMTMDGMPAVEPIVRVIDDWFTARPLALAFEARVGGGSVLVTSIDLAGPMDDNPVARQMRHSLLAYMGSERFRPKAEVTVEQIRGLIQKPVGLAAAGAKILEVSSQQDGFGAENSIDGRPATIWHSGWSDRPDPMPHSLTIDLGRTRAVAGVRYLPRDDMSNGRIGRCAIFCSNRPNQWSEPVARAVWKNSPHEQQVRFAGTIEARYIKIVVESEVLGRAFASAAEFDLIAP